MKHQILIATLLLSACSVSKKSLQVPSYDYTVPVDTRSVDIHYQEPRTYQIDEVYATNDFPAARLNNFTKLSDGHFRVTISPENFPINPSPWYAFKVWSNKKETIKIELHYPQYEHRYHPKLSLDGAHWTALDTNLIQMDADTVHATFPLDIGPDTLWVAAQEIQDSRRVGEWVNSFADHENVTIGTAGESAKGRPLYFMNLSSGDYKRKPTVIVISRQHPPEVTGYFAMQSFIETIIEEGSTNGFLAKYRVMVYPLMNPDGVDLGHYRHNTGGVDLNRDWSAYHQPEIANVTSHMVKETVTHKNDVLLGLDFHSTYYDIYYTPDETVERKIFDFTSKWLEEIRIALGLDDINELAGKGSRPTSSAWFNRQFGATGITYEIGDDTPREFIKRKGEVSAQAMMNYFLSRE